MAVGLYSWGLSAQRVTSNPSATWNCGVTSRFARRSCAGGKRIGGAAAAARRRASETFQRIAREDTRRSGRRGSLGSASRRATPLGRGSRRWPARRAPAPARIQVPLLEEVRVAPARGLLQDRQQTEGGDPVLLAMADHHRSGEIAVELGGRQRVAREELAEIDGFRLDLGGRRTNNRRAPFCWHCAAMSSRARWASSKPSRASAPGTRFIAPSMLSVTIETGSARPTRTSSGPSPLVEEPEEARAVLPEFAIEERRAPRELEDHFVGRARPARDSASRSDANFPWRRPFWRAWMNWYRQSSRSFWSRRRRRRRSPVPRAAGARAG